MAVESMTAAWPGSKPSTSVAKKGMRPSRRRAELYAAMRGAGSSVGLTVRNIRPVSGSSLRDSPKEISKRNPPS